MNNITKAPNPATRRTPSSSMGPDMSESILNTITPKALVEHLQKAGFRAVIAERNGFIQIGSATQGADFSISLGNLARSNDKQSEDAAYLDFTFNCFALAGDNPPVDAVTLWNRSRRFGRLWAQPPYLVLAMDVSLSGGIADGYLRAQIELWERLVRELILHLRATAPPTATKSEPALLEVETAQETRSDTE